MRLLILTDDLAAETTLDKPLEEVAGGEHLGDALAEFEADTVVLVDPDDEDLAAAVRERYGLPVTEFSAG